MKGLLNTSPQWKDCGGELRSHPGVKSIPVTNGPQHSWKRENIFCLWFMVFPSGTLLVDSLNCPSRQNKLHSKNQYTPLWVFSVSVLEYVFWWSVSHHYDGKWWGVSYYTPLAGIGFYFPEEYLYSMGNIDQEFTVSSKGAEMCGSCCHCSHIPTAETYE